jgi:hypothetical protein
MFHWMMQSSFANRGYAVSVEMHAVKLDAPDDPPKVARSEGDDEASALTCAKAIAEMTIVVP